MERRRVGGERSENRARLKVEESPPLVYSVKFKFHEQIQICMYNKGVCGGEREGGMSRYHGILEHAK